MAQNRLVPPEPAAPAVLDQHDSALEHLARRHAHMVSVGQQPFGDAQIADLQCFCPRSTDTFRQSHCQNELVHEAHRGFWATAISGV